MNVRTVITSLNNPQIKNLALLQKKAKARKEQGLFVVEGIKMFEEARDLGLLVKSYLSESFYQEKLKTSDFFTGLNFEVVSDQIFKQITDTMTPQGIMGTVKRPVYNLDSILSKPNSFLLILEDIRDPGNLRNMISNAEGGGGKGNILNRFWGEIMETKGGRGNKGFINRGP